MPLTMCTRDNAQAATRSWFSVPFELAGVIEVCGDSLGVALMNIFDTEQSRVTVKIESAVTERMMTIDITHDLFISQLRCVSSHGMGSTLRHTCSAPFDGCTTTNGNKLTTNFFLSYCVRTGRYYHPGAELGIVESESAIEPKIVLI